MKITCLVHGTRGDVQPMAMVALALQRRGHEVTLAAPPNLTEFVRKLGLRPEKLAIDSQAFLESPEGRKWLSSGNATAFMKEMSAINQRHRDELDADFIRSCQGADLIVAAVLTEDRAVCIAEQAGIPMLTLHLAPLRATAEFPAPLVTRRHLPFKFLNRASHALLDKIWWGGMRDDINRFRAKLGLAPTRRPSRVRMRQMGIPTVHAYSSAVLPAPSDWGADMPVVGYIRLNQEARERLDEASSPPDLADWLHLGPPAVFFGFGSMPIADPPHMLQTVVQLCRAHAIRAVVGAGWSTFAASEGLPDSVRVVTAVNHDWLLPQCAAAVHHGGAGTLAAATMAGIPSIVCSVFADQPFWGARAKALGIGVHLPFATMKPETLSAALKQALSPQMRTRAAELGARVAAEPDASARIVELIEGMFPAAPAANYDAMLSSRTG
jgi:sterol 3beta-glucosyltransferase